MTVLFVEQEHVQYFQNRAVRVIPVFPEGGVAARSSASTPQKTSNTLLPQAKTSLLLTLSKRIWYDRKILHSAALCSE
jgi:hypothetical protein